MTREACGSGRPSPNLVLPQTETFMAHSFKKTVPALAGMAQLRLGVGMG